jgi:hypothetical protein
MENRPIIRSMYYLSSSFLKSALILSNKCLETEKSIGPRKRGVLIEEYKAYFYGAIFNCVSYLESYINELFVDISEGNFHNIKIDDTSIIQIKELWNLNIPKIASCKTIDKYQVMLIICNKSLFKKSLRPYQDVDIIIKLRNSLIHYEPEYIQSTFKNPDAQLHKFEKLLHERIEINPFATKLDDYYPTKIISYSCCNWAIKSISNFIDDFNNKIF